MKYEFRHGLCVTCIEVLAAAVKRTPQDSEESAMNAGKAIMEGSRDLAKITEIAKWKAPRAAHHIEGKAAKNPGRREAAIALLDIAADPTASDSQRLDALLQLDGVSVPMASAILTCLDEENYTVVDFRTLGSLGVKVPTSEKIYRDLYLQYLEYCRTESRKLGVSLRTLDRALWKAGSAVN